MLIRAAAQATNLIKSEDSSPVDNSGSVAVTHPVVNNTALATPDC
jgi:hypothetical protein